ncbi:hypothetical protein ElyMa_003819800 [Elysia marginata]|uniref:Methyltransferase FkbM domain-containing protein n=1 Tax=Elysia marginata TaxID=1093978 RepID=A0AAV4FE46_9GAST|nr:hypothetical protein ElyMa_003819800 [Elysia marginata]
MLLVLVVHILLCNYSSSPRHDLDLEANIRAYQSLARIGPNHSFSRNRDANKIVQAPIRLPRWFRPVDLTTLKLHVSGDGSPFNCTISKTSPAFRICVHSKEHDKYISAALLSSGLWEPFATRAYQQALTFHPDAAVVDIGANIGYYTLLAAAMGHSVVAVEPQRENLKRLAEAAKDPYSGPSSSDDLSTTNSQSLSQGQRNAKRRNEEFNTKDGPSAGSILLLANAVSDAHRNVSLTTSADNQGGVRVVENCGSAGWFLASALGLTQWYRRGQKQDTGSDSQGDCSVTTITLDDVLNVLPSPKVIIKVDIEGYECRALATSHRFFSSVQVPYILMEWRQMRERQRDRGTHCTPAQVSGLALFLARQGYVPHEMRSGMALDPHRATGWVLGDVYWRAAGQRLLVPSW